MGTGWALCYNWFPSISPFLSSVLFFFLFSLLLRQLEAAVGEIPTAPLVSFDSIRAVRFLWYIMWICSLLVQIKALMLSFNRSHTLEW